MMALLANRQVDNFVFWLLLDLVVFCICASLSYQTQVSCHLRDLSMLQLQVTT